MNAVVIVLVLLSIGTCLCWDRTITMEGGVCDSSYDLDDEDDIIYLKYKGNSYGTCKVTIETNDFTHNICAYPETFDLACGQKLEYHNYIYTSSPDKEYSCYSKQYSEYCQSSKLVIAVEGSGSSSNIKLKISLKEDSFTSDIADAAKTAVYIIVGIVVAVIVVLILSVVVIIYCCCRRRNTSAGTVYRAPAQAATTTTVAYPMNTQPGYQPQGYAQPPPAGYQQHPPAGYQQPSPAGYQPPPQTGYQQPPAGGFQQPPPAGFQQPAGYPPAVQQGYAGYQQAPITDKASAPPMEPPPYS